MIDELKSKWQLNKELLAKEQEYNLNDNKIRICTVIIRTVLILLLVTVIMMIIGGIEPALANSFKGFVTVSFIVSPILLILCFIIRSIFRNKNLLLKPELDLLKQIQLFELQAHINEMVHAQYEKEDKKIIEEQIKKAD